MSAVLGDFEHERLRESVRYSLPLTDEAGEQTHELVIVGEQRQIQESFGESEFDVTIRPGVSEEDWADEMARELFSSDEVVPREAFDHPRSWSKDPLPEASGDKSVLIAVRRLRPGGTGLAASIRGMSLAPPSSALFIPAFGPRGLAWFVAQSRPLSGDPDLTLDAGLGRVRTSSTFPDGIWDWVGAFDYPRPPTWTYAGFFPAVTVIPFTPCTTFLLAWWWNL